RSAPRRRPVRPASLDRGWLVGGALLVALTIATAEASFHGIVTGREYVAFALAAMCLGIGVIVWHVDPAWSMSGALVLAIFSGNWGLVGFPRFVAPDRFALMAV